jgi:hypothetical protein
MWSTSIHCNVSNSNCTMKYQCVGPCHQELCKCLWSMQYHITTLGTKHNCANLFWIITLENILKEFQQNSLQCSFLHINGYYARGVQIGY